MLEMLEIWGKEAANNSESVRLARYRGDPAPRERGDMNMNMHDMFDLPIPCSERAPITPIVNRPAEPQSTL